MGVTTNTSNTMTVGSLNDYAQQLAPNAIFVSTSGTGEAAIATKADRQKISLSDFAWPEQRKFPITSQQQVNSAAKLMVRAKTDDATRARIKARIKRIANRKGFSLPKAWQN